MFAFYFYFIFISIFSNICFVSSGAIQINSENIDSILSSNEIVFLNFYANWCRFSQMLNPIYDQLAEKVSREFTEKNRVVIGKVDCDSETSISTKYHVNKFPTLKLFRHGLMTKREYRGARQIDSFFDFIRQNVQSAILKISTPNDLLMFDRNKRFIIGHFQDEKSENFQTFSKVANLLRDDCQFVASTNSDQFKSERSIGDVVYYRSTQLKNETFFGSLKNHEEFYAWSNEKCLPLVREITFANAEELTDEGLPFLILFHDKNDENSVSLFEQQVAKQLLHELTTINCLHADGTQFIHPLQHLGKTIEDLPLLVLDSFRHMFPFPDFKKISINGKLLEFVKDFNSGKLHRDFHNLSPQTKQKSNDKNDDSPPESVFVLLTPSRQRYSFRDEL